ncbi:MAG: hypothetical protein M2R45_02544 [Verrucomicrobia subdivision 3 bacterium]|nr:hypothetical protein [Limisphaerales bacterium]MCS1414248.1 hypothetical protein [Limisphaerales bacterium]
MNEASPLALILRDRRQQHRRIAGVCEIEPHAPRDANGSAVSQETPGGLPRKKTGRHFRRIQLVGLTGFPLPYYSLVKHESANGSYRLTNAEANDLAARYKRALFPCQPARSSTKKKIINRLLRNLRSFTQEEESLAKSLPLSGYPDRVESRDRQFTRDARGFTCAAKTPEVSSGYIPSRPYTVSYPAGQRSPSSWMAAKARR